MSINSDFFLWVTPCPRHVLSTTFDALKLLLFLVCLIAAWLGGSWDGSPCEQMRFHTLNLEEKWVTCVGTQKFLDLFFFHVFRPKINTASSFWKFLESPIKFWGSLLRMHPLRFGASTEQPVPVGIDLSLYCDGHHRGHLTLGPQTPGLAGNWVGIPPVTKPFPLAPPAQIINTWS